MKRIRESCPNHEKINETPAKLGVDTKVKELRRRGKFYKSRKNSRTVLITINTEHEARLVLAKIYGSRSELRGERFSDAFKKILRLKKRREQIKTGVPPDKLKLRNFELFTDGK